jgi:predicted nucleic acid-binding protein
MSGEAEAAERAYIDANVLWSASYRADTRVRACWSIARVTLVTSAYAIDEAMRNIEDDAHRERLIALLQGLEIHEDDSAAPTLDVDLPEKDIPILRGAINAGADVLVTGDLQHFGRYFGALLCGVLVMPPADFLARHGVDA